MPIPVYMYMCMMISEITAPTGEKSALGHPAEAPGHLLGLIMYPRSRTHAVGRVEVLLLQASHHYSGTTHKKYKYK